MSSRSIRMTHEPAISNLYRVALALGATLSSVACTPSGDLDAHARGIESQAPEASEPGTGAATPPQVEPLSPSLGTSGGGEAPPPVILEPTPAPTDVNAGTTPEEPSPPPTEGEAAAADAGIPSEGETPSSSTEDPTTPAEPDPSEADPTESPAPTEEPPAPTVIVPAPALPIDLRNAPVDGEIVFSDEAEWEIDGVFEPTFEIHTPTASYWIAKPLGTMVSMQDRAATPAQWIDFSSGFRPLRGVPQFPTPPATRVTTVRDEDSTTPTHVRLTAESNDGAWQWVWDFYVTHVTFTINRAPGAFGFSYRGVPGGSLGPEDELVLADGTAQSARGAFDGDLAGPVEWAYIADTALGRSLFTLQHTDDPIAEHYQVRDNDSAHFSFGNGRITSLPMRFSLGIINSDDHDDVEERAAFVARVIR